MADRESEEEREDWGEGGGGDKEVVKEALQELLNEIPAYREWATASGRGKERALEGRSGPADAGPSRAGTAPTSGTTGESTGTIIISKGRGKVDTPLL